MSFSIQTNANSLIAQENLRVNSNFQAQTIRRLTSGYRINQSGDDAAGLAIANKFRSDTSELTQGVRNANDGVAQLQIIDGGMSNISKMLDRLRVLSTQSGSDTFTGDRNVLNSEFQTLLTEIDRQSQSIGLDTNGQFAKSLQVFIGGGRAAGTGVLSIANGIVTMDLTSASVDTRALGLTGMQLVAGTIDIGPGSATQKVEQIVADGDNASATGTADFYFSGPGFSDGSKVKVAVSLSGVTDISSLVANLNAAIQNAGNGTTQAASAFKAAGIVASVHTDSGGGQQLALTSSTAAFQMEAGNRMANAFMGNFVGVGDPSGAVIANSFLGGLTAVTTTPFVPTNVTLRVSGASLNSPVDLTFNSASTTVDLAITDLVNQFSANATLQAAGLSVTGTAGSALTFTSALGETFEVQVTGDTAGVLGLGTFIVGNGNEADYATRTGAAYDNTVSYGVANLELSINGAASIGNWVPIDLAGGDATAAVATGTATGNIGAQVGKHILLVVNGTVRDYTAGAVSTVADLVVDFNTAAGGWGVAATMDASGHIVLTSTTKGANSQVNVTGGASAADLGLANVNHTGLSRTGADIKAALNAAFAADAQMSMAGLQATNSGNQLIISSANGTRFRINSYGSGPNAANADIGFGVTGTTFAATTALTTASNAVSEAGGVQYSQSIDFAALAYGNDDQAITLTAIDSAQAIHSATYTLRNDGTARNARTIDEAVAYLNTQLQQSNDTTLKQIVAVKEDVGGTEKINFLSALKSFSVGVGSSGNGNGLNSGGAESVASQLYGTAGTVSIDSKAGAASAVAAVASAVSKLGAAQAVVGKSQNQLGYSIGLAQSQISSFSSAESQLRDADIAAEAANLTKASVLQQATMAAMAQANSAPQAVLALLRG